MDVNILVPQSLKYSIGTLLLDSTRPPVYYTDAFLLCQQVAWSAMKLPHNFNLPRAPVMDFLWSKWVCNNNSYTSTQHKQNTINTAHSLGAGLSTIGHKRFPLSQRHIKRGDVLQIPRDFIHLAATTSAVCWRGGHRRSLSGVFEDLLGRLQRSACNLLRCSLCSTGGIVHSTHLQAAPKRVHVMPSKR